MKWNSSFKSRHPHKDLESSVDIKSIFLSFWNAADCPFCQVCQFSNLYFGKSLCHQVFGLCQSQPQPRRNNSQCSQNFYEAVAIKIFVYIYNFIGVHQGGGRSQWSRYVLQPIFFGGKYDLILVYRQIIHQNYVISKRNWLKSSSPSFYT